jgi:hypothetical protein
MRRLRAIGFLVGLMSASLGFGRLANAQSTAGGGQAAPAETASTLDTARAAALLGRMHRAAEREVQLGEAAEAGAASAKVRVYGAELKSQFGSFDERLKAFAAANRIPEAELDRLAPGENVVAMQRQVDSLTRLANTTGASFDREFWVAVATEQAATSDALTATLDQEPALAGLVSDFSALLDRSSRRASVAAEEAGLSATPPANASPESPAPAPTDRGEGQ